MKFYERVISDYGGYEKCKDILSQPNIGFIMNVQALREHMLEYRRQHNIFEVGDLIMYENKMYEIKYIYHPEKARITDGLQGRTVYDFPRGIRHATDEEIKAGKRLEVKSEN